MGKLSELIEKLRAGMPALSCGLFSFEEYVLLPYYGGNVMLRFGVSRPVEEGEIDALERELYALLPEGVFADFMGEVYREAGMDIVGFPEKLAACAERYLDEEIPVSPFADEVNAEAERLLALAGLPLDLPVWEIQPDGGETALLILSDRQEVLKRFETDGVRYTVLTVDKLPCEGLMKAAAAAKRLGISLLSAVEKA